jgi:tRNA-modifying protein YgfZ
MPTIRLQRRALAKFSGPEAEKLLDDTLTGRMQMAAGSLAPWALLSPQGKVQAEGLAYRNTDGSYWLDFDREVADSFLKRMKMYRLRAKVEIADLRASHVLGWSAEPVTGGVADPRRPDLGFRVIAPVEAATAWSEDTSGRDRARIDAGILELGPDYGPDSQFAHDVGLDLLNGIDFVKGCYIGQEVVSRMKHRGTARRRPVVVSGIVGQPPAGTPILASGRDAGAIGQVADGRALAIVRLDRVTDLAVVTVDGAPVTLTLPGWATYGFGEGDGEEA